jgi:hypothetical protein
MRWEAHTRTAQKILQDFDVYHFQKYEKDLINGIIYPDANDPKPHFGREEAIRENVRKARERRLDYNPSDSFFYLGMTFHYIQDSWVGMDPDHEEYPNYEKHMDKCTLLNRNESMFQYYPVMRNRVLTQFMELEARLDNPVKTPSEMYELVSIGKPFESTAFLDVNFAYRVCHRVAEMVLQPMLKVSLDERLSKLHTEYTEKLVEKEKSERDEIFLMEESLGKPSEGTLSGIDTWKKRRALNKRTDLYGKEKHLGKVFNGYKQETSLLAAPFIEWFNVQIPELVLPELDPVVEDAIFPLAIARDSPLPLL